MSETVTAALSSAAGFPLVRMISASGGLPMGCERASSKAARGSGRIGISFIVRMSQFGGTRMLRISRPYSTAISFQSAVSISWSCLVDLGMHGRLLFRDETPRIYPEGDPCQDRSAVGKSPSANGRCNFTAVALWTQKKSGESLFRQIRAGRGLGSPLPWICLKLITRRL